MLKKELKKALPKIDILLTRETDKFIPLEKRTAFANSKKGDLFSCSIVKRSIKSTYIIERFGSIDAFWVFFINLLKLTNGVFPIVFVFTKFSYFIQ